MEFRLIIKTKYLTVKSQAIQMRTNMPYNPIPCHQLRSFVIIQPIAMVQQKRTNRQQIETSQPNKILRQIPDAAHEIS